MADESSVLVSKSKVLDVFIADNEDPLIVVTFLQQHDYMFDELIAGSLYWNRIFQLDYFFKCNRDCRKYIVSKLQDIPLATSACFIWQILASNSIKANEVKYECRILLKSILNKAAPMHPYKYLYSGFSVVKEVDKACEKYACDDSILSIPFMLKLDAFRDYYTSISHSLFSARMLQYDLFSVVDIYKKWIMLGNAEKSTPLDAIRFILQLLDSGEELEVKKQVYEHMRHAFEFMPNISNEVIRLANDEVRSLILSCSSVEEFMLKSTIYNYEMNPFIILHLLMMKPKWIKTWAKIDGNGLDCILNISKLVEVI